MSENQKLKITEVDPETLIPDPENVRIHDERNRETVRRSIKRFGIRKPVVAQEGSNIVYAGNLTLDIVLELKLELIPVAWIPADVPVEVCRAYAVADNRTSDLSEFNPPALKDVLNAIAETQEIDLEDVGFSEEDLSDVFAHADTSFLDSYLNDFQSGGDGEIVSGERVSGETESKSGVEVYPQTEKVKVLLLFEPSDRNVLIDTLNTIKSEQSLETHADALLWLVRQWRSDATVQ